MTQIRIPLPHLPRSLDCRSRSAPAINSMATGARSRGRRGSLSRPNSGPIDLIVEPEELCCPLTAQLMRQPVLLSNGRTVERSSVLAFWRREGRAICPQTREALANDCLVNDVDVREKARAVWERYE